MEKAIQNALTALSACDDPMDMLLNVWTDAGFPCSFDEFCAAVQNRSLSWYF